MKTLKKVTAAVLLAVVMSMSATVALAGPSESPGVTANGASESPGFMEAILFIATLIKR